MGDLRRPFFIAALALLALVIVVQLGAAAMIGANQANLSSIQSALANDPEILDAYNDLDNDQKAELQAAGSDQPPGLAISYLALVDGLLLFTMTLLGVGLIFPAHAVGRIQGLVTFGVSLLVILIGILLAIVAIIQLVLMVSLLLSVPFGTLAYLAKFGFFDRGGASLAISLVLTLKIAAVICLVIAQQRFLQNRGLMLLLATSFIATLIVSFLHGFVPLFLVSITDAIGAILMAIIAVIWAIYLLIRSLGSVFQAIRAN